LGRVEGERHECRARRHERDAELPRDAVAQVARADLGDGQPAGGDDEAAGRHRAARGFDAVGAISMRDGADAARLPALDAAVGAFGEQHGDDRFTGAVAKELALVLFVKGDAVALHERDEVPRRVAREGGAAERRVGAQEVLLRRARVELAVGEVSASAARDADLLGHPGRVVDDEHLAPALAGQRGAVQPRGTCAEDHGVEVSGGHVRGKKLREIGL